MAEPYLLPDGSWSDGRSFTSGPTGQDFTTPGMTDPGKPYFVPGSGYWVPGQGWVTQDVFNKAQQTYGERKANGTLPQPMAYDPNVFGTQEGALGNPYGDVSYYRNLTGGGPQTGAQIGSQDLTDSRGLSMGALDMVRMKAEGLGGPSPAEQLQAQQTQGAVNGLASGAATIKGGAAARAAASMTADQQQGRVAAQGAADGAALAAKEKADAANQYFGLAQGQRGRDLSQSTSQAGLDAQQRGMNEQRGENYESMAFNQQKAIADDQLGKTAETQNAENTARTQAQQQRQADIGFATQMGSAALGAGMGAAKALGNTQGTTSGKSDDPWDPSNYSGSDPRMKKDIRPVSDAEAKRLKLAGEDMKSQIDANSAVGRVRQRAVEEYDGKYLPSPFPEPSPPKPPGLMEAIEAQVAEDRKPEPTSYEHFDELPATHPAGGWSLGEGFSDDPKKFYGSRPAIRPENTWAPGSADFYAGSHSKDLTTSDPAAKREAFVAGMEHANSAADSGHFGQLPEYMEQGAPKTQPADTQRRRAETVQAPRKDATPQRVENIKAQGRLDNNEAIHDGGLVFGPGAYLGAAIADQGEAATQRARSQTAPSWTDRLKDTVFSDPKTKQQPKAEPRKAASTTAEKPETMVDTDSKRPKPGVANTVVNRVLERAQALYPHGPDDGEDLPDPDAREPVSFSRERPSSVDTSLSPADEAKFVEWKKQYAPTDLGTDYDLRGAFKAGLKPDPQSGHWPDTFKKPNHETFSDESQYSKQGAPGHWEGDTFFPPVATFPTPNAERKVDWNAHIDRALTTSEPKAKEHFGAGPMAAANRSMAASSYEYKPEFLPEDQTPGEVNVGPMADKMKADPVAGTAIVTDPQTGLLAIDKTKGLKLVMGGLASLQRQVDDMKGKRA